MTLILFAGQGRGQSRVKRFFGMFVIRTFALSGYGRSLI